MSILCHVLCCAEKQWTLQEILDIRNTVPPSHSRLLPSASCHHSSSISGDADQAPSVSHMSSKQKHWAACIEGIVWHYLTVICPNGSLWQGCCCCCPYTCSKAHKSEQVQAGRGIGLFSLQHLAMVWFNHSIKPPEKADRKQMGLSLLPPSKYFLLTWWDKTVQHSWVKQRRCGSTVQLEVDIPDRTICLAVYAAGEMKPQWLSTKCLYLEVQKSPCIKFTMTMSLYFQQHLKEHFPFVLLLQQ